MCTVAPACEAQKEGMLVPGAAVVTGGTGGIGLAIARALAAAGARVAIVGRCRDRAEAAAASLPAEHRPLAVRCDVGSAAAIDEAFPPLLAALAPSVHRDRPLLLVNAAGVSTDALLLRSKPSELEQQLRTNLLGAMLAARAAARPMVRARAGAIVNVGSVVGTQVGSEGQAAYAASKAGLEGFTRSLAREMGRAGVRVTAVCPGYVHTQMTAGIPEERRRALLERIALRRFGTAEEVAAAVLYLASAPYVTGTTLTVDGGLAA